MDRPKSAVRVIRGVAKTVHTSRLFVGKFLLVRNPLLQSSSGMYGICYRRIFDYVSVS